LVECFHEECAKPHFHHGKYKDTQAGFQQVCETYCNRDIKYMKKLYKKVFLYSRNAYRKCCTSCNAEREAEF